MSPAILSSAIMALALILFISDRIRPDAVALIVLLIAWITGLVSFEDALAGFGAPAVIIVAAVLVIGRAVELTGAAQAMTSWFVPNVRFFSVRVAGVLLMGMGLSAFMNNIAALAITMPVAMTIAREHKVPPGAVLMPLAFATILGGITTLIGTPANLIISSVREDRIGQPFGMFDMTAAGGFVALAGLLYLVLFGWRLAPKRPPADAEEDRANLLVYELSPPMGAIPNRLRLAALRAALREAGAVLRGVIREGARVRLEDDALIYHDDRLLVMSRVPPWEVAPRAGVIAAHEPPDSATLLAQFSVIHGSPLIGQPFAAVEAASEGEVRFVAAGVRAAQARTPLEGNAVVAGDQLFLRGSLAALAKLVRSARLLEIDRQAGPVRPGREAMLVMGIYAAAVLLATLTGVSTTAAFLAAAVLICLLRLIPADEAYRAIDLPVIVLLACMIPIGREFNETGGSDAIAAALSGTLGGVPLFWVLVALGGLTAILTVFLNNVATAIVMAQVGVETALALGIPVDAALIAVLVGCSCDFLTPIGHQNNMLVMRPGNYLFRDYPKVGAPLSLIAVFGAAWVLTRLYG